MTVVNSIPTPPTSDASAAHDEFQETEKDSFYSILESFPLNEAELEMVLKFWDRLPQGDCSVADALDFTSIMPAFEGSSLVPEHFLGDFLKTAISTVVVVGGAQDQMVKWTYLEAIVTSLGRRGPQCVYNVIFSYCLSNEGSSTVNGEKIVNLIYRIILACHALSIALPNSQCAPITPSSWLSSLPTETLTRRDFLQWMSGVGPCMYTAVSTIFHRVLFSFDHDNFQPAPFSLPQLHDRTQFWANPWEPFPVSLATHSHRLGGQWRRLYSSNEDSLSFRVFASALIGYHGPTVCLVMSTTGDAFGFYTDSAWKFSKSWYGNDSECFIFSARPLRFFHPTGVGKMYQYLCLPSSHRENDLKGLAIGGISAACPRIHLTESLEGCRAVAVDSTFESGPILSDDLNSHFDVDILEVFAVGVSDDEYKKFRESGKLQVAVHEATRRQAAIVDRNQFVDDFVAGAFLNKGFEHRAHCDGRLEFKGDK